MNSLFPPFGVGGAERSVQHLANAVAEKGVSVAVLSLHSGNEVLRIERGGLEVTFLPLKNVYWPFGTRKPGYLKPLWHLLDSYNPVMARATSEVVTRFDPDIVHTNNLTGFSPLIWKIGKDSGASVVHTLRDYYLLCPRSTMFRNGKSCASQCLDCAIYSAARMMMSKHVDTLVGVSQFILDKHTELGLFAEVGNKQVIFNPYPVEFGNVSSPNRSDARLNFGYLGRLHESKGVGELLRLFERRSISTESAKLFIAGKLEGAMGERVRRAADADNISALGFVTPNELFRRIDVLVVPSLWNDPLPRVIFEAYAHGKPVIASNRGGIPEIVEDGVTGMLYDPVSPHGLRKALDALIEKPYLARDMAQHAYNRAARFTPDVIGSSYFQAYTETLRLQQAPKEPA